MRPSPAEPDESSAPPPTVERVRATLRAEMPVTERWAYFDHAAVAPLSGPAQRAIAAWADQAAHQGDTVWPAWDRTVESTRRRGAGLLGASPEEVALVANTTAGIGLVADGLDWRDGDNVVVLADEFPSNLYPWMNLASLGVETRRVPTDRGQIDPDKLRAACDRRTRVVSVSWVGYASGCRQDLERVLSIAHSAGGATADRALFFLDAIQGLGVLPIDVKETPVDFLAADGHKWMLGPEGAGLFYLRREHLERLRPLGVGWHSVVSAGDFGQAMFDLRPTAARYEGGSANMPGLHALEASLELLTRFPTERVAAAVFDITDYLCERLRSAGLGVASIREGAPGGHDPRSGIVSVDTPSEPPAEARRRCLAAGAVVSVRGGRLRVSAHAYNDRDDVDRLVDALRPAGNQSK